MTFKPYLCRLLWLCFYWYHSALCNSLVLFKEHKIVVKSKTFNKPQTKIDRLPDSSKAIVSSLLKCFANYYELSLFLFFLMQSTSSYQHSIGNWDSTVDVICTVSLLTRSLFLNTIYCKHNCFILFTILVLSLVAIVF